MEADSRIRRRRRRQQSPMSSKNKGIGVVYLFFTTCSLQTTMINASSPIIHDDENDVTHYHLRRALISQPLHSEDAHHIDGNEGLPQEVSAPIAQLVQHSDHDNQPVGERRRTEQHVYQNPDKWCKCCVCLLP